MEETTTTESAPQESSGVIETQGVPTDGDGNAIPDTQLEDAAQDEAGSQPSEEETPQEDQPQETQEGVDSTDTEEAPSEDNELTEWAKKKNLPLDDPIKLAKMVRESEQKMHQVTQDTKLKEALPQPEVDEFDQVAQLNSEVQQLKMQTRVNDFYASNPEARNYDSQMATLVQEDPGLAGNLKALYALARFNELNTSSDEIRKDGGRDALTKLAQKQSASAVRGNAVDTRITPATQITPQNVDQLVGQNSQEWFEKNYDAINKAMETTN